MRARRSPSLLLAVALAGCGGDAPAAAPPRRGSTLRATLVDPDGDGVPRARARASRCATAPSSRPRRARRARSPRFGQLTDTHVRDEESPARVPFLDRLGAPLELDVPPAGGALRPGARRRGAGGRPPSTRRPWSSPATSSTPRRRNELDAGAARCSTAARCDPDSRRPRLRGRAGRRRTPTRFYLPAGRRRAAPPGPARGRPAAVPLPRPAARRGTRRSATTTSSCRARSRPRRGSRRWPPAIAARHRARPRLRAVRRRARRGRGRRRAARPTGTLSGPLAARAAPTPGAATPTAAEVVQRLAAAAGVDAAAADRLDYTFDVGPERARHRARHGRTATGGSRGVGDAGPRSPWLRAQLARAGDRWTVVVSPQPARARATAATAALAAARRGPARRRRVAGNRHRNTIEPPRAAAATG